MADATTPAGIPIGALVVSTTRNDYYVIPREALDQFRATQEQRDQIDTEARAQVPGTFAPLEASEAAAQPNFASEPETTALAWFHTE